MRRCGQPLFEALVPGFETLAAISQQAGVVGKVFFKAVFSRGVVFAVVIAVMAAYIGPLVVNATVAVSLKMLAGCVHQQIPAIFVLVDTDTLMGNLPEQMVKIPHGAGGGNLLGNVGATFGFVAKTAFVVHETRRYVGSV